MDDMGREHSTARTSAETDGSAARQPGSAMLKPSSWMSEFTSASHSWKRLLDVLCSSVANSGTDIWRPLLVLALLVLLLLLALVLLPRVCNRFASIAAVAPRRGSRSVEQTVGTTTLLSSLGSA